MDNSLIASQRLAAQAGKTTIILHPNPQTTALAWVHEILPSGRILTTEVH